MGGDSLQADRRQVQTSRFTGRYRVGSALRASVSGNWPASDLARRSIVSAASK
jgi:hypothetical protein